MAKEFTEQEKLSQQLLRITKPIETPSITRKRTRTQFQFEIEDSMEETELDAGDLQKEKVLLQDVSKLLEQGADVNSKELSCDSSGTVTIIITGLGEIRTTRRWGATPLEHAVRRGDPALVKLLLLWGASVNEPGQFGLRPIDFAEELGFTQIVKLLVEAGSKVDVCDGEGFTPLEEHHEVIKKLHDAMALNESEKVIQILNENQNLQNLLIHSRNPQGQTLLHVAVEKENPEIVEFLIRRGVLTYGVDHKDCTALDRAMDLYLRKIQEQKKIEIQQKFKQTEISSGLFYNASIQQENMKIIECLRERWVQRVACFENELEVSSWVDENGLTQWDLMNFRCQRRDEKKEAPSVSNLMMIIGGLIGTGASISDYRNRLNFPNSEEEKRLFRGIRVAHLLRRTSWKERKPDELVVDKDQFDVQLKQTFLNEQLISAVQRWNLAACDTTNGVSKSDDDFRLNIVKKAVEEGAEIDARDPLSGKTALHRAVENGYVECVRWLIDNGAFVHAKDCEGREPMDWFLSKGVQNEKELKIFSLIQSAFFKEILLSLGQQSSSSPQGLHWTHNHRLSTPESPSIFTPSSGNDRTGPIKMKQQ